MHREGPDEIQLGSTTVHLKQRQCTKNGEVITMTAKEFGVLQLLIQHRGETVSRERFLDEVWGYAAFPSTRTVDNHIAKLRGKLEENANDPKFILTVPKAGYRLKLTDK